MKYILFAFIPLTLTAQVKPIAAIYGGASNYQISGGIEAGAAIGRVQTVAFVQGNSIGGNAKYIAGIKTFVECVYIDSYGESFVAPVMGAYRGTDIKGVKFTNPFAGIRYQVYGGYGELLAGRGYFAFNVGFQFGNRKR